MRINRQRKVNRYLSFYANNFGFRKPYQLLIDGTFCHTALKDKINISDQLPNYLDGEVKLLTTPCAILETEKLGPPVYGAMLILKKFAIHRCGHSDPISASSCFMFMLGRKNKNRYMVATQDRELQSLVRSVPATPLLFIHRKAPTLEAPSAVTAARAQRLQNIFISDSERKTLKKFKEELLGPSQSAPMRRRKRKTGGPNPLSCKKKKTDKSAKKKKKKPRNPLTPPSGVS